MTFDVKALLREKIEIQLAVYKGRRSICSVKLNVTSTSCCVISVKRFSWWNPPNMSKTNAIAGTV